MRHEEGERRESRGGIDTGRKEAERWREEGATEECGEEVTDRGEEKMRERRRIGCKDRKNRMEKGRFEQNDGCWNSKTLKTEKKNLKYSMTT